MTEESTIVHGVDLEAFGAFADYAADNPEAVQFELGATSTYEGTCAHSLARIDSYKLGGETFARDTREYTIPFGGWREVLDTAGWVGATDRLEPVEVALSALASCINVGISINALAHGVELERLSTRLTADFDPGVLFGLTDLGDADSVFENLTADIEIESPNLDEDQIDEWARRAPVYTLVSMAQDVRVNVNAAAEVSLDD